MACADADDCLDLIGAGGENYRARKDAKVGEAVALIGLQLAFGSNETGRADNGAELIDLGLGKHARSQDYRMRVGIGTCIFCLTTWPQRTRQGWGDLTYFSLAKKDSTSLMLCVMR